MSIGYRLPSFTVIICGLFCAYFIHSIWTISQLFVMPTCVNGEKCFHSILDTRPNMKFQMLLYMSERLDPMQLKDVRFLHRVSPFDLNNETKIQVSVPLSKKVRNNGTLYLHMALTDASLDAKDWQVIYENEITVWKVKPLTQYQVPEAEAFNLLQNDEIQMGTKSSIGSTLPVTHFQTEFLFHVMTESLQIPAIGMSADIYQLMIHSNRMKLSRNGDYLPLLYIEDMGARIRNLQKVEKEMELANLIFHYSPISYGKLRMWLQFELALTSMGSLGFTTKDLDEVKGIFTDTNLYLLVVTFLVAALHMLFDFLAFKNDISFWRSRNNMAGISTSSVAWRAFSQLVVLLYLYDEKTSALVLIPAAIGAVIELWKVTKAFHIELDGWTPRIKGAQNEAENTTHKLDSEGIRYLSFVLYPLLVAGAIYSLLFTPHKSWYSWLVNSMVNGVYAFGFLFMLPQLFINYKLKSVAHLPWRSFMYKAFNTFIDDLFAFIITMPTAHRVACFRDDVVFVIYLFQKWQYPVDKNRVNEFGESAEGHKKKE